MTDALTPATGRSRIEGGRGPVEEAPATHLAFPTVLLGLAVILAGCLSTGAMASFASGNALHDMCGRSPPIAANRYITGLVDGLLLAEQLGASKSFCLPAEVTAGQLMDVVCRSVASSPAQRHVPASYIATASLKEAFPCRGAQ